MFDWLPTGVELQEDVTVADWIVSSLEPWGDDGFRLESLLPGGFDGYVRVFHPTEEWNGSESVIRSWTEIGAERGVSLSPEVSFAEVVGLEGSDPAEWLGLAPEPGRLPTEVCRQLARTLAHHTRTPADCWFGLSAGQGALMSETGSQAVLQRAEPPWNLRRPSRRDMRRRQREQDAERARFDAVPKAEAGHGRDYLILHGPIDAATSFEPMTGLFVSPSVWWPDDRAWVVATEIDGLSTLVGGSRDTIRAIFEAPGLEAIEVTRDMLVD